MVPARQTLERRSGRARSVIPTPAEKQSGPMEIGAKGCHRNVPTSLFQCGGCQPPADSRIAVHLTPPGTVGFDNRTWGTRPFPFRPRPRCASAAPGSFFEGPPVAGSVPSQPGWNFRGVRSYQSCVRRFANQGIGLSLRDRLRDQIPGASFFFVRPGRSVFAGRPPARQRGRRRASEADGAAQRPFIPARGTSTRRTGRGMPAPERRTHPPPAAPSAPRARVGSEIAPPGRRD